MFVHVIADSFVDFMYYYHVIAIYWIIRDVKTNKRAQSMVALVHIVSTHGPEK